MAKKKNPNGRNPPATEARYDMSEEVANLKALNNLLLRETVENRNQIDALRSSNQALESEIALALTNHQRLDQDKSLLEDLLLMADIERDIRAAFLSSSQLCKIETLSKMTQKLNFLGEEREGLRLKLFELEKNNGEVREELKRTKTELDAQMEERKETAERLRSSIEEKLTLQVRLDSVMGKITEIVKEKEKIEQERIELEGQIEDLQKQVCRFRAAVSMLEESSRECEEKNNLLQSDMDRIICEKDAVSVDLDQQMEETEGLRSKIREMEKIHEEKQQEVVKLKIERDHLVEERKEKERSFELLMKAKISTESSLVESKERLRDLQIKIEHAEMVSHQALLMLKLAAETINYSENEESGPNGKDVIDSEEGNAIQPFAKELEAIKSAYRGRLHEVEEMRQELKSLQMRVAESKKTSLWTLLFSATTVFSAVSLAFVARGR